MVWVRVTSADVALYVWPVAPAIAAQFAPAPSHRFHWYANEIGAAPLQPPELADSVWPSCGLPEIAGAAVLLVLAVAAVVALLPGL